MPSPAEMPRPPSSKWSGNRNGFLMVSKFDYFYKRESFNPIVVLSQIDHLPKEHLRHPLLATKPRYSHKYRRLGNNPSLRANPLIQETRPKQCYNTSKPSYSRSGLNEERAQVLQRRLDSYMQIEKAYLDPEPTIATLAKQIVVPRRHLTRSSMSSTKRASLCSSMNTEFKPLKKCCGRRIVRVGHLFMSPTRLGLIRNQPSTQRSCIIPERHFPNFARLPPDTVSNIGPLPVFAIIVNGRTAHAGLPVRFGRSRLAAWATAHQKGVN